MRALLPRFLLGAAVTALLLVVAAGIVAVQYSAWALEVPTGGATVSVAGDEPRWVGYDLVNRSAVPVTLRGFVPHAARDVRVLDTRVVAVGRNGGFAMIGAPLPPPLQAELDASRPVDGFVLPPGSDRYELVVLIEPVRPGEVAELGRSAITYRALGLDQGVFSSLISRFRPAG